MFVPLARQLAPRRVVALDQRAHGDSDGGGPLSPQDYVADAAALLRQLGLGPVVVVGHSMGGVIAYLLAAQYPQLVAGMVIEDIGVVTHEGEVAHPVLDVGDWPRRAQSLAELRAAIESRGIPDASYFLDSAVADTRGWRLLFDPGDMMSSQQALLGDYWRDWLASTCPARLLRAEHSTLLSRGHAQEMVRHRPNTGLVEFSGCGHWIHDDDPAGYARAVTVFLAEVDAACA